MTMRLHFVMVLLVMALLHAVPAQAQVVDRMVAVVNKRVILESELDQATRVEFLLQAKPIEQLAQTDRLAVLERLIDRSLLEQQIVDPTILNPGAEDLAAKIKELREGLTGAGNDERWKTILAGYGLTQQDVEEQLTSQFRILRFIDLRFRGLVQVDKDAIAAYYQDQFLPAVRKRNVAEPKLSEVSDKIEQILAEQRIDGLLNNWLKTLRAQAHVERMLSGAAPPNAGTTP